MKHSLSSKHKLNFWTWALWALVFLGFSLASVAKIYKMTVLKQKIIHFEKKMLVLDQKNQSLTEDLESSHDPVWLELALMEELGVIPEGAIKINYPEDP